MQAGDDSLLISDALSRMGFQTLHLAPPEESGAGPAADDAAACELLLVSETSANSLRKSMSLSAGLSRHAAPPIIVVCSEDRPRSAALDRNLDLNAHLNFDGILRLPLSPAEVAEKVEDVLRVHHAQATHSLPLRNELSMLRKVLESVSNGVCIADASVPDLPIVYINPAFEKMTGYTIAEVRGRNCRFLQAEDTQQAGLAPLREAIRNRRETVTVLRNFKKDGTPFWNELHLSPIADNSGRVTHFVGIQNDVTQRIELEKRLAFLAHHDALTGIANRALLFERMQQELLRADRSGTAVAVLYFDLNNFKQVNDNHGHDAGDTLLRIIADRLQQSVRACDTVARIGGDEFIAMIPDIPEDVADEEAYALVDRLIREIGAPVILRDQVVHPSASTGWSVYPRDGRSPEQLLQVADFAMYANRQAARRDEPERQSVTISPGTQVKDAASKRSSC
jgi:diguanylate cyclase (GGDEF)-like protein/PAS domain S-box-containing protein